MACGWCHRKAAASNLSPRKFPTREQHLTEYSTRTVMHLQAAIYVAQYAHLELPQPRIRAPSRVSSLARIPPVLSLHTPHLPDTRFRAAFTHGHPAHPRPSLRRYRWYRRYKRYFALAHAKLPPRRNRSWYPRDLEPPAFAFSPFSRRVSA
jgi:hypothetical protein